MRDGFTVTERIDRPVQEVWTFLSDLNNAGKWMTGITHMKPITPGSIGVGSKFSFSARGAERESEVTACVPNQVLALTSTQGGVTATYEYSLTGNEQGTQVQLHAVCSARGVWRLVHPLILFLMKKSDSGHLVNLKRAIETPAS